ncbi:MAG: lanthionine synthetase C family protein [bacterium]|nr:lanthionine synthetase C family protein [bacterium]
MKWTTWLDKKNSDIYRAKLSEIADALMEHTGKLEKNSIGLMGGKVGVALFFFYYAQMTMEEKYVDYAHELLSDTFEEINNEFTLHTFAGGLAGIGWTVEHVVQNDLLDADTDEILAPLDPFLHKAMLYDINTKNYDFLHGAIGNGTYFLSRLRKKEAQSNLAELVDLLGKISDKDANGLISWESVLDRDKGSKGANLSLSHGMASIIVFLAKTLEKGIAKEKSAELLEGAVRYMMAHRLEEGKFLSCYPSWVSDEYPPDGSRLAWCYGDLGIGVALWQAGQSADNNEWRDEALKTMLHSTKRTDIKENSLVDPGLCHGAAGLAHIYNRMYHYSGNDAFKEPTRYWMDVTMKMASYEDGYAGFKAWHTEKYGGWVAEVGFLEGIAGIGLAFISVLSEIEPKWDRCLFLS